MDFETLKQDYEWGWITKEGLKEFITYGVITQEQYNSIIDPVPIQPKIESAPVKATNTTNSNEDIISSITK